MGTPLTCWRCDTCGELIEKVQEGYVVWHSRYGKLADFKIIHTCKCDANDHVSSAELARFLGPEGLSYVLSLASAGPIRLNGGSESPRTPANLDEFVDFIRRVQVPYYEEARAKFDDQQVREDFSSASEFSPYRIETLRQISQDY